MPGVPWCRRSWSRCGQLHQLRVRNLDAVEGLEPARVEPRKRAPNGAAVAHNERWQVARRDLVDRSRRSREVLRERLTAAREAELRATLAPGRPRLRLLALDLGHVAPLPRSAARLGEALVHARLEPEDL